MSDAEVLESTSESAEAGNISVVVRIRSWPGNQPGEPCIGREGDNTIVIAVGGGSWLSLGNALGGSVQAKAGRHSSVKSFTVHQVFDNSELSNATLASQEAIFSNIGTRILQNSKS